MVSDMRRGCQGCASPLRHSRESGNPSTPTSTSFPHPPPPFPPPPTSFPRRRESIPGPEFDKTEPAYYPEPNKTPSKPQPKEKPPCTKHTNPQPHPSLALHMTTPTYVMPAPGLRHSRESGNPSPKSAIHNLRSTIPPRHSHTHAHVIPAPVSVIPA